MKKVRITESELKGIVREMIRENIETKYAELAKKGFNPQEIQNIKNNFSAVQILNKMDLNREIINSDKPTIHTMLLQPDKVKMNTTTIGESQLRGLVRRMIKENVEKETSSIATIVKYYNQSNNNKLKQKISNYGNSRLPENPNHKQLYDFLNKIGDKNKLEMIKKMLEKDIQNKSITESQLRGIVKRMIREEYQSKLSISDMSSQLQALPDASLNSGKAIETLMSLLPQLDPLEAKKYVKSHLLQSPNDGFRPSGKMVFRFPRPMGKDVDIPIDVQAFKQYL